MRIISILIILSFFFISLEAYAGLGNPLKDDSLTEKERETLLRKLENTAIMKEAARNAGEDKVHAVLERIPDSDLKILSENLGKAGSSPVLAATLGEAIGQLLFYIFLIGILIMVLFVLGVVALFAGGAAVASTPGSAPVGKAQYDEQRRKVEDTKRLKEPDRIER